MEKSKGVLSRVDKKQYITLNADALHWSCRARLAPRGLGSFVCMRLAISEIETLQCLCRPCTPSGFARFFVESLIKI